VKLDELPLVLTIPEVAAALRIGRNQAYRLAESGAIGAIRLGSTWRVPRHRLEQLLGDTEEAAPGRSESPERPEESRHDRHPASA
jgi:excisionase family DNA binding protein